MDANIQYLNDIQFGEKLVGQKVLVRADFELYNPNIFEGSDLGLSEEGIIEKSSHMLIDGILSRPNQSPFCFAESRNFLNSSVNLLAQRSCPTGTAQPFPLGFLLVLPESPQ